MSVEDSAYARFLWGIQAHLESVTSGAENADITGLVRSPPAASHVISAVSAGWLYTFAHEAWFALEPADRAALGRRFGVAFQKCLDGMLPAAVRSAVHDRIGAMVDDALTARLGQVGAEVEKQTNERLEKEIRAVVDERIKSALAHVKRSL
jgi:delta 1-pyrroline-5-carboxylate dehydrogenase